MSLEYATVDYLFYPPPNEETSRAGIIPYANVDVDGELVEMWLLGELHSRRLSDFGGGCLVTNGETPFECLLREVDEESNGLLTETIRERLDTIFKLVEEEHQDVEGIHVWRWVNRNRPEDIQYLIFLEVDYNSLRNITVEFNGNEENRSIDWYERDALYRERNVQDFNSSIQKFMRRFDFNSQSPRRK